MKAIWFCAKPSFYDHGRVYRGSRINILVVRIPEIKGRVIPEPDIEGAETLTVCTSLVPSRRQHCLLLLLIDLFASSMMIPSTCSLVV